MGRVRREVGRRRSRCVGKGKGEEGGGEGEE
jgi:hypothetical protein